MKSKIWKLTSLLFLIVFSLTLAELYLMFIGYPEHFCKTRPIASAEPVARFDPVLGWSYKKKFTGYSDNVFYIFNEEGYRTDTVNKMTDFSKPIILIIGDSMLFGHGLQFRNTFGSKLNLALNKKYEIVNFAVQGYGTDQMFLMLKRVYPIYKPEFVIMNYVDEHLMRNVNIDRREIIPCMRFIGTKPSFEIKNGKLKQINRPMLFSDYDTPLLFSLVRDIFREKIEVRTQKYGRQLTLALFKQIQEFVGSRESKLYIVNLSQESKLFNRLSEGEVLGISTLARPDKKFTLSDDDMHPNPRGTDLMVDEFINKFNEEFRKN